MTYPANPRFRRSFHAVRLASVLALGAISSLASGNTSALQKIEQASQAQQTLAEAKPAIERDLNFKISSKTLTSGNYQVSIVRPSPEEWKTDYSAWNFANLAEGIEGREDAFGILSKVAVLYKNVTPGFFTPDRFADEEYMHACYPTTQNTFSKKRGTVTTNVHYGSFGYEADASTTTHLASYDFVGDVGHGISKEEATAGLSLIPELGQPQFMVLTYNSQEECQVSGAGGSDCSSTGSHNFTYFFAVGKDTLMVALRAGTVVKSDYKKILDLSWATGKIIPGKVWGKILSEAESNILSSNTQSINFLRNYIETN
jgi:hypothetical protein